MKKMTRTAAVVAALVATTASWAADPVKKTAVIETARPGVFVSMDRISEDPVFKRVGDKVQLNMLNLDQKAVIIRLINSEGEVVFEEKISRESVVSKSFNFEYAFRGQYTIRILDDRKTFEEVVTVE